MSMLTDNVNSSMSLLTAISVDHNQTVGLVLDAGIGQNIVGGEFARLYFDPLACYRMRIRRSRRESCWMSTATFAHHF